MNCAKCYVLFRSLNLYSHLWSTMKTKHALLKKNLSHLHFLCFSLCWVLGILLGLFFGNYLSGGFLYFSVHTSIGSIILGYFTTLFLPIVLTFLFCFHRLLIPVSILLFLKAILHGVLIYNFIHFSTALRDYIIVMLIPNSCSILMLWQSYCSFFLMQSRRHSHITFLLLPAVVICVFDYVYTIL